MTSQKSVHLNLGMIHVLYWNNKNTNLHRLIFKNKHPLSDTQSIPFSHLLLIHSAYVCVSSRIRGIRLPLRLRSALASGKLMVDLGAKQNGTRGRCP